MSDPQTSASLAWAVLLDPSERVSERVDAGATLAAHLDGGGTLPDGVDLRTMAEAVQATEPGCALSMVVESVVLRMLRHPSIVQPDLEVPSRTLPGPYRVYHAPGQRALPVGSHMSREYDTIAAAMAFVDGPGDRVIARSPDDPSYACYAVGGAPAWLRW